MSTTPSPQRLNPATRDAPPPEPLLSQIAGFVDLLVWLMVLKSFFIPLFIIPTGSMAETLYGEHGIVTCSNCAYEHPIGFDNGRFAMRQCPNCRFLGDSARVPRRIWGDRIVVHGWNYDLGGALGPQRWDVVVFKTPNPPQENFIKRLIGLPGETIELIGGDVWVTDKSGPHVARKTRTAQQALWFPFFNQDYLPRTRTNYDPRWLPSGPDSGWTGLDSRVFQFDGAERGFGSVRFVNESHGGGICQVTDAYGYNGPSATGDPRRDVGRESQLATVVTDVRVSAEVDITAGAGFVELLVNKWETLFRARIFADGRVTLERGDLRSPESFAELASARVATPVRARLMSLGHADLQAVVEIDGRPLISTTPEQYSLAPQDARDRSRRLDGSIIRVGAERVSARLAHIRIDRDVHYTNDVFSKTGKRIVGNGVQDAPIVLQDDDFFVLGDNSPRSADGRFWQLDDLGPKRRAAAEAGAYRVGTVPRDQLIGRAFLVYWPGFLPLPPLGLPLLPDVGRVRWIH